jgi:hypothetical protein
LTDKGSDSRSSAIAAAVILLVAGVIIYFMPMVVLAIGAFSPWLASIVGACLVLSFFLVFWLRARFQRRNDR